MSDLLCVGLGVAHHWRSRLSAVVPWEREKLIAEGANLGLSHELVGGFGCLSLHPVNPFLSAETKCIGMLLGRDLAVDRLVGGDLGEGVGRLGVGLGLLSFGRSADLHGFVGALVLFGGGSMRSWRTFLNSMLVLGTQSFMGLLMVRALDKVNQRL